jgi:amidase
MSGSATGPLHGVPSAIKDLFDFKPGWPCAFGGVWAMKRCVAQWRCVFAERVERAGAILLGKANDPTMGLRGTCDNYLFDRSRNPFDVRKNAGGSSPVERRLSHLRRTAAGRSLGLRAVGTEPRAPGSFTGPR